MQSIMEGKAAEIFSLCFKKHIVRGCVLLHLDRLLIIPTTDLPTTSAVIALTINYSGSPEI